MLSSAEVTSILHHQVGIVDNVGTYLVFPSKMFFGCLGSCLVLLAFGIVADHQLGIDTVLADRTRHGLFL